MTAKFCVIGKNISYSLSPRIHAAFGSDAYGVEEITDGEALARFVRGGEYCGFNVTIPYKREIIPLLDGLSDEAKAAGAVNCVARIDGKYKGFNFDIGGMEFALERAGLTFAGKRVMILGSGGASRAAQYLAKRQNAAETIVVSRTGETNYSNCHKFSDVGIIVNATPVGSAPDSYARPIDISAFPMLEGVLDAVYSPLETLLSRDARERGLKVASGLDMLVEQARLTHNLFCEAGGVDKASRADGERVCDVMLKQARNIVLIGMAGAGKTSAGRALAKLMGRAFYDSDEIVVARTGKDIPAIFEAQGEAKFREYETSAIKECCAKFGAVISTGGGAVCSPENRFYMQSNGVIVYLERSISELAREGRPLYAQSGAVHELAKARVPIYESLADIRVAVAGDADETARKILKELEK